MSDGEAGGGGRPWPPEGGVGAVKVLVGSGEMVILGVAYATGPNLLCERRTHMRGPRTALDLAAEAPVVVVNGAVNCCCRRL